jgi:hypothetical protein
MPWLPAHQELSGQQSFAIPACTVSVHGARVSTQAEGQRHDNNRHAAVGANRCMARAETNACGSDAKGTCIQCRPHVVSAGLVQIRISDENYDGWSCVRPR